MSSDAKPKGADNECIQVVVRCRPLNKKEIDEKRLSIIDVDIKAMQVSIKNPENLNETPKYFTYDAAYDDNTQQRIFYDESCFGVIEGTLEGFNSTIFAYGQTGCGKSFTMQGPSTTIDHLKGVTPNSFSHIFQFVKASKDIEFLIRCSYLELYNEEIKDLLSNAKPPPKCELKEDPQKGVYVKGLTDVVVESAEDLNNMLDRGLKTRTVASTNMNAESSRSHSIFTIIVEMNTKDATSGKDMLRVGKLNLVDLAGSERQKKTGATGSTQLEGIKINLSLSALGNVISALSEGSRHIPYRDSKLTRLLQDSLGGNTKTMMIAAISPADYNYEETMSTLRYANRAKNIKNKPKINEDPKDTMIREFKEEIERLRKMLADQATGGSLQMSVAMNTAPSAPVNNSNSGGGGGGGVDNKQALSGQDGASHTAVHSARGHAVTADQPDGFHASSIVTVKNDEVDFSATAPLQTETDEDVDDDGVHYSPDKDHLGATYSGTNAANVSEMSALEREKSLREDVERKLHQLEHMLVSNDMAGSVKVASNSNTEYLHPLHSQNNGNSNTTNEFSETVHAPTAEEIEEEEEAARLYQLRREEARRKKEIYQAKELKRVLEEKKAMEEELEELRVSTTRGSSGAANNAQGLQGTSPSPSHGASLNNIASTQIAEVTTTMNKKLSRMKKRYEKKLAAAKEALEDLQEDFSFQRKQFVDAATEQEKDVRLYEMICQSVLSEKDFKKIIEKCRYDEDADEWIVPFTKKKALNDSQWQSSGHTSTDSTPTNRSLFPDINAAPSNMTKGPNSTGSNSSNASHNFNSFQTIGSSTLRDPSKLPKNVHSFVTNEESDGPSPVPLLTLPGNLVSSSSVMAPAYSSSSARKNDSKVATLPQISGRSDNNNNPDFSQVQMLPAQQNGEKKKKKSKVPKGGGGGSGSGSGQSNGVGYSMSSARSNGEDCSDQTDNNDASYSSAAYNHISGVAESEAASQESAGPPEDWGFIQGAAPAAHARGKHGPELEYSDDEDFESGHNHHQQHGQQYKSHDGPYPPAYGNGGNGGSGEVKKHNKKKKKSSEEKPSSSFLPAI